MALSLQCISQCANDVCPQFRWRTDRVLLFRKAQGQPSFVQQRIVFHRKRYPLQQGGFAHAALTRNQHVLWRYAGHRSLDDLQNRAQLLFAGHKYGAQFIGAPQMRVVFGGGSNAKGAARVGMRGC